MVDGPGCSALHCPLLGQTSHCSPAPQCPPRVSVELPDPGDVSGTRGSGDRLRPGQGGGGAASERHRQETLSGGLGFLDGPRNAPRRAIWPQGNSPVSRISMCYTQEVFLLFFSITFFLICQTVYLLRWYNKVMQHIVGSCIFNVKWQESDLFSLFFEVFSDMFFMF